MNVGMITGTALVGGGVTLMARVVGNAGTPVTQASLSTVAYAVRDLTDALALGDDAVSISDAVFDDLVTDDPRWNRDSAAAPGPDGRWGYNFAVTLPASLFDAVFDVHETTNKVTRHRVQADVLFTPTSGEPFVVSWAWSPVPTWV
jgi:hypothetical protein